MSKKVKDLTVYKKRGKRRRTYNNHGNIYTVNETALDDWSKDVAYFLGYATADGCIRRSPSGYLVEFTTAEKDREILVWIKKLLGLKNHKIGKQVRSQFINGWHKKSKWTAYRLQFQNSFLSARLLEYGIVPNKTKRGVTLPEIPKEFIPYYFLGLLDGDGCISVSHTKKAWELLTILVAYRKDFLQDVANLLKDNYGLIPVIYHNGSIWRLQYSIKSSIILYHLMYDNPPSFYLQRKRDKFEEFFSHRKFKNEKVMNCVECGRLFLSNYSGRKDKDGNPILKTKCRYCYTKERKDKRRKKDT